MMKRQYVSRKCPVCKKPVVTAHMKITTGPSPLVADIPGVVVPARTTVRVCTIPNHLKLLHLKPTKQAQS
jgi:hypothetical protein